MNAPSFIPPSFRQMGSPMGIDIGVPVRLGLVGEYRFTEGAGQVLTDYSTGGHNGQLGSAAGVDANDPTWSAEGATFTTDDYITLGNVDFTSVDHSQLSVFAVVAPSAIAINLVIISKYTASNTNRSWNLAADAATASKFLVWVSSDGLAAQKSYTSPAGILVNGTYVQVGFTFNAGTLRLYSGGLEVTPTKSVDNACPTISQPAIPVLIGQRQSSQYWEGTISYVVIYNRELSPSEVYQNYVYMKSKLAKMRGIPLA